MIVALLMVLNPCQQTCQDKYDQCRSDADEAPEFTFCYKQAKRCEEKCEENS